MDTRPVRHTVGSTRSPLHSAYLHIPELPHITPLVVPVVFYSPVRARRRHKTATVTLYVVYARTARTHYDARENAYRATYGRFDYRHAVLAQATRYFLPVSPLHLPYASYTITAVVPTILHAPAAILLHGRRAAL